MFQGRHPLAEAGAAQDRAGAPPGSGLRRRREDAPLGIGEAHLRMQGGLDESSPVGGGRGHSALPGNRHDIMAWLVQNNPFEYVQYP